MSFEDPAGGAPDAVRASLLVARLRRAGFRPV
jgi:hypothetical protein